METTQKTLERVTYEYLEPDELRQAQIPAGFISAARIDIQSKYLGCDYSLFYSNYQDEFELCIADDREVFFFSRPFVYKRIENVLKARVKKGTNRISLEKAMDSEDIAKFTERCKFYFKRAEIAKMRIWEIEKDKLPKEKISKEFDHHWFLKEYAPITTKDLLYS